MYKLFTDKTELFECDIKLTGALVTSTTAIMNTELNYLSGVTSNIQTQIHAAAATDLWSITGNNIYYNTGNVGIGTTSPGVSTTTTIEHSGNGTGSWGHGGALQITGGTPETTGTQGLLVGVNTTNGYSFLQSAAHNVGHNDILLNPKGGNVGIGTTDPNELLHIDGNVEIRNTSSNSDCYINMIEGNALNGIRQLYDGANNAFKIQSADNGTLTTRFTVMRAGNIGIGTPTPQGTLDVNGDIYFSGDLYQNGVLFSDDFILDDTSQVYTIDAYMSGSDPEETTTLSIVGDLEISGNIFASHGQSRELSTAINDMIVLNADDRTVSQDGNASVSSAKIILRRDDGNFYGAEILGGLPTGSTTSPVDLEGAEYFAINTVANGTRTRALSILNNGNVGIGTTSPNENLTIKSGSSAKMALRSNHDDSTNLSTFYISTPSQSAQTSNNFALKTAIIAEGAGWSRSNLHFCLKNAQNHNDSAYTATVADSKMVIDYDGNVGIGTTSPTSTLHVAGDTATFATISRASGIKFIPSSYNASTNDVNNAVPFIANNPITNSDYIAEINNHSDVTGTANTINNAHFQIASGDSKQRSIIISSGTHIRNIQGWSTETSTNNQANISLQALGGNVGIGTTSPGEALDIVASTQTALRVRTTAAATNWTTVPFVILETLNYQANINLNSLGGGLRFSGDNVDNNQMILSPDGYLGIGTTNPEEVLHVNGNIRVHGDICGPFHNSIEIQGRGNGNDTNGNVEGLILKNIKSDTGTPVTTSQIDVAYNGLYFHTNETERMRITSAGNVGIGTDTPESALHVDGAMAPSSVGVHLGTHADSSNDKHATIELFASSNKHAYIDFSEPGRDYNARIIYQNNNDNFNIVNTQGNVGIGQSIHTPTSMLHVNGTFRATGNAVIDGTIQVDKDTDSTNYIGKAAIGYVGHTDYAGFAHHDCVTSGKSYALLQQNNGNTFLNCGSGRTIAFRINNDHSPNKMTMDSNGLDIDGILTTNAVSILNYSNNTFGMIGHKDLNVYSTTSGSYALLFSNGGATYLNGYGTTGTPLRFRTNGADRMYLHADGNFGIGTNNPTSMLHVNGNIQCDGLIKLEAATAGGSAQGRDNTYIAFGMAGTGSDWAYLRQIGGSNTYHMALDFHDDSNDGKFSIRRVSGSTFTSLFHIDSSSDGTGTNGYVGIGTDNPSQKLHVDGTIQCGRINLFSSTYYVSTQNSQLALFGGNVNGIGFYTSNGTLGNEAMRIANNGNVGIGTTSPSEKLQVIGNIQLGANSFNSGYTIANKGGSLSLESEFALNFTTDTNNNNVATDVYTRFLNVSTELMRIRGDGNVGIGTTTPASKLHIHEATGTLASVTKGTITLSNGAADGTNGGNSIVFLSNDNYGSDYAYIEYQSRFSDANESGLLTIGCLNDGGGNDNIAIMAGGAGGIRGYVGIGTETPSTALHISTLQHTTLLVESTGGSTSSTLFLKGRQDDPYSNKHGFITFQNINHTNDYTASQIQCGGSGNGTRDGVLTFLNNTDGSSSASSGSANLTPVMTLHRTNVGIGTTSPAQKLHVDGTIRAGDAEIGTWSGGSNYVVFSHKDHTGSGYAILHQSNGATWINAGPNKDIRFGINDITKMIMRRDGRVGIGTTSPSDILHVNGYCRAVNFIPTSDDRVKHNETPLTDSLGLISQLRPKRYLKTREMYDASFNITIDASGNYTDISENDLVTEEIGIIAQEVQSIQELSFLVKPSLDASGNETGPMGLDYQSLFVLSIKAIQEQQTMIESLTQRLDTLQTNHDSLSVKHNNLETDLTSLKTLLQSKSII